MASGNDMKAASATYEGFIGLLKYGSVVVIAVAAFVIWLIA